MTAEIKKELLRLEQQQQIKILYAVESGSRAWGFASTDSDWDVRYLYIHHPNWYFKIDPQKDSHEEILPNDIDLSGWELKKALRLFRKSNPPLLEWLRSPIVYLEQYSTAEQMRALAQTYFNPRSCLYHYLNMAEGNYRAYLQKEMVRTKKYFYVLRPVLACEWIKQTGEMAPMEFDILVNRLVTDKALKTVIGNLSERKKSGEELNEEPRIAIINEFLDEKIRYFQEYIKTIDINEQPVTAALDQLFKETLSEVWNTPSIP